MSNFLTIFHDVFYAIRILKFFNNHISVVVCLQLLWIWDDLKIVY